MSNGYTSNMQQSTTPFHAYNSALVESSAVILTKIQFVHRSRAALRSLPTWHRHSNIVYHYDVLRRKGPGPCLSDSMFPCYVHVYNKAVPAAVHHTDTNSLNKQQHPLASSRFRYFAPRFTGHQGRRHARARFGSLPWWGVNRNRM